MMKNAQLGEVEEAIMVKFFGEDAYVDATSRVRMLKSELLEFVRTLLANLWNKVRKTTKSQYLRLQDGKKEAMVEYESTYGECGMCVIR
jgi:hypothetical protein